MHYSKVPLTYAELATKLLGKGLAISNRTEAENFLAQINYYRLKAYFYPFLDEKRQFRKGISFDNIINVYSFDRELRLLVLDEIERIEVAFRAQMIYKLAHKYGAHWQDDENIFEPAKQIYVKSRTVEVDIYADTQDIINRHCNAPNPEPFVKHYINKYNSPSNPPSWMCIELLTIGELSRLYTSLDKNNDKKDIAGFFKLHHNAFRPWMHSIVYVRNLCAHHSRLWNRELSIKPEVLESPQIPWIRKEFNNNNHRVFYFLCVLQYMLASANPTGHFKAKLLKLFEKYPDVPIQFMGIPSEGGKPIEWSKEPLWN